jgi:hypothetical protein
MAIQTQAARPIDPDKLNALLGQAVQDMGAALHAALIVIGDRLGLYRTMSDEKPITPAELAARTEPPNGMFASGSMRTRRETS